jgi:hypothetical protein
MVSAAEVRMRGTRSSSERSGGEVQPRRVWIAIWRMGDEGSVVQRMLVRAFLYQAEQHPFPAREMARTASFEAM